MKNIKISRIKKLKDLIKIMSQNGNYNYNHYMHGLCNGLICAISVLEDKEYSYIEAPKNWLCEKKSKKSKKFKII